MDGYGRSKCSSSLLKQVRYSTYKTDCFSLKVLFSIRLCVPSLSWQMIVLIRKLTESIGGFDTSPACAVSTSGTSRSAGSVRATCSARETKQLVVSFCEDCTRYSCPKLVLANSIVFYGLDHSWISIENLIEEKLSLRKTPGQSCGGLQSLRIRKTQNNRDRAS